MNDCITVGMDLGDKLNCVTILNESGEKIFTKNIRNTKERLIKFFKKYPPKNTRIIMETGTHSPWISHLLETTGYEVLVVNPTQLPLISKSIKKNDWNDSELLARIGRLDKNLLKTIRHKSPITQEDLVSIKARNQLVEIRTGLINHIRGILKSFGIKPVSCSTGSFVKRHMDLISDNLKKSITPMLELIEDTTSKIKNYDQMIIDLSDTRYPKTKVFQQVQGVGPITALTYLFINN